MAENNPNFNIRELADKWAQGTLTSEEQAYLEKWYADFNDEQITLTESRHENSEALRIAMLDRINTQIRQDEKPVRTLWTWTRITAAASVIIGLSIGGYFVLRHPKAEQVAQVIQDLQPGGNRAILTLANGKKNHLK